MYLLSNIEETNILNPLGVLYEEIVCERQMNSLWETIIAKAYRDLYKEKASIEVSDADFKKSINMLARFINISKNSSIFEQAKFSYADDMPQCIDIEIPKNNTMVSLYFGEDSEEENFGEAYLYYELQGRSHIASNTIKGVAELLQKIL